MGEQKRKLTIMIERIEREAEDRMEKNDIK